ncbi:hypothetical protein XBP1_390007 [Xenorhabdus bovienii str. puntauvense]|uniref:Uncharacterized protein n=1 Tax=Xenorhabdus bovienii str. puntauvense TaxID=1398201 RepID=A0A077NIK8_XENBV|nr:hypothetical protein XBP1_390007 [Xenorhabdus bovienii str. puntauvense]
MNGTLHGFVTPKGAWKEALRRHREHQKSIPTIKKGEPVGSKETPPLLNPYFTEASATRLFDGRRQKAPEKVA